MSLKIRSCEIKSSVTSEEFSSQYVFGTDLDLFAILLIDK